MAIINFNSISGVSTISVASSITVGNNVSIGTDRVTATTFAGNVTGNLTGNVNSTGVTTVTTLNATSIVGVTTAGITTAYVGSVNDGPLAGFRNFIINGDMAISQRGTSFTDINTYTVDRWRTFGGPITFTVTQQDSIATYSPSRYAIRFARNSGQTQTNDSGIAQGIETRNSYALRGKRVTISFKARCGANYSAASSTLLARVFTGTGTDENPVSMTSMNADIAQSVTLTTSLQSFSVTGTLSSSLTQATLTFSYTPTGTAGANDWFEVTDVQLEIGDRATPFERRSYGQELALCQRYYERRTFANSDTVGAGGANTGNTAQCWCIFHWVTEKRAAPTCSLITAASTLQYMFRGNALNASTFDGFYSSTPTTTAINYTLGSAAGTVSGWTRANGTLTFDASIEL
jgi:hypothetical protein